MSYYPAPDSDNPQPPISWDTGQNAPLFSDSGQPQPSPYLQPNQGQPAAYGQQQGYPSSYQPQPAFYGQQPGYQSQPAPYTPQVYVPQPQYIPVAPIIPVAVVYDAYAGQALAGMIIGIISFVLPLFWIMPILGIVFSCIGMKSTTRRGMAIAGLVCSIIAMVTAFCWFPFLFL